MPAVAMPQTPEREPIPAAAVEPAQVRAEHAFSQALTGLGRGDRRAALPRLRSALEEGRAEIRRRLESGAAGAEIVSAQTSLMDRLLRALFHRAETVLYPLPNPTSADRLALVAVGGYGRCDLAPGSDVDALFLHPYKPTARCEQIVEYLLYTLWDLGLSVGHAVRSVSDCLRRAQTDMTIRTAVLESRHVAGDEALYGEFRRHFLTDLVPGTEREFVAAKLRERDERHARTGESRYLLEPHVKDGKGGLRDLHTLFWIAKYLHRVERFGDLVERGLLERREHARFAHAEDFLWRVRAHLHIAAGRAEDRLTFDMQPAVAARMGFGERRGNLAVERFMKRYFLVAKTVGELTRVFCAALEAERLDPAPAREAGAGGPARDGLTLSGGRIAVIGDNAFAERPARLVAVFRRAQTEGRDIHPATLRLIHRSLGLVGAALREDPEANRTFRAILTDRRAPDRTLRMMNEAGVLGRFLPDFGHIVAQTQHDMYHAYTVDEHSIRAVGALAAIESGARADELPLASTLIHEVQARDALYLALFLHDVGKGQGGDHSEIGGEIAHRTARRLGYTPDEVETVVWLVRRHLLFSHTAFKRDVNDPRTVEDFASEVHSLERLRLLLVLTAADIAAVGPGRWNAWKGSLLRTLYRRTEEMLAGGRGAERREDRAAEARRAFRERLADWPAAELDRFEALLETSYWLSTDTAMQARHAQLARRGAAGAAQVETRIDRFRGVTEMILHAPDRPGLFETVAGAVAAAGANVVDARAFTTLDGMALDSFWLQNDAGAPFDDPEKLERLRDETGRALAAPADGLRPPGGEPLPRPAHAGPVAGRPHVLIDDAASRSHTVIEVSARDRPGLLRDVARAFGTCGLSIGSAHISTMGARAVDVFYVKDRYGMKLSQPAQMALVRARVEAVLGHEPPATGA